jgi:hypothetical protein
MSLLRQHPQREGESNADYSARLDALWKASPAGQGLSRLGDLRSLRRSLAGTRFAADVDAFAKSRGADPAEMDAADREHAETARAAREQAFADREAARAARERASAERLDSLHVDEMDANETAAFEAKYGLTPSRHYR